MLRVCKCGGIYRPYMSKPDAFARRCDKCSRVVTQRKRRPKKAPETPRAENG